MNERYINRYSPRPIDAYSRNVRGVVVGPASSCVLNWDGEAWNLAWLSHEYETMREPADPRFTTLVQQSVNMVRASGRIDITGLLDPSQTMRGLLQLAPEEFMYRAETDGSITRTALYAAYGDAWLDRVRERAHAGWQRAEQSTGMRLSVAASILARFTKNACT